MVNTYTLEEAARVLGVNTDEARKQLKNDNVREFQDPSRKTFRYPVQAVDELARRLGQGSDPQLQLGESRRPKSADSPPPRKKVPEDQVDMGAHAPSDKSSSKKRLTGSKSPSPSSKSPSPRQGSDSDVRLVAEGSDLDFKVASDSDVKMIDDSSSGVKGGQAVPDSKVRVIPPEGKSDSDVKIVPDASDSGSVPLHASPKKSPSDSDIRLQSSAKRDDSSDSSILTDEIDLDVELRKAAEKKAKKTQGPPAAGKLSAGSPYELSQPDVTLEAVKKDDSSDDFVLTPGSPSSSSEIELSSSELRKLTPEDEVSLGASRGAKGDSGINLHDPADSGVSLEKKGDSSDEAEFELSLDSGSTPKPKQDKKAKKKEESSSEFELSLEKEAKKEPDSDSEFELSLDVEGSPVDSGSDSEFELTLDDSGGLAPIDEEKKDIFATDFEVPALDEESGQRAAAGEADTDLESSDFDIALEEGDAATEDAESGSQVVALEDEAEADEGAETVARPRRGGAALDDEAEVDELLGGEAEEEGEEEMVGAGAAVAAEPAPWGPVPAIGMGLTVIVMLLVLFISYEQLQIMWGYRTGSGVAHTVSHWIGGWFHDLPKE
jgi:hypothetical protein